MEYLLSQGADRRITRGNREGQDAIDVAGLPEMKKLLMNYEKRLCVIVCDDLSRQQNTNVYLDLYPQIMQFL